MNVWLKFSGIFGAVLFLFGLLGALLIFRSFTQPFMLAHMVVGIVCLFGWFLTAREKQRSHRDRSAVTRKLGLGLRTGGKFGLAVLAVVLVNALALRFDRRWDLTQAGVYSLSAESQKIIVALKEPVHVTAVLLPPKIEIQAAEDLLERYRSYNPATFSYEIVDPRLQPHRVEGELGLSPGEVVHVAYGKNGSSQHLTDLNEERLTNALLKLSRGAKKRVYSLIGHQEADIHSTAPDGLSKLVSALDDEQIELRSLQLELEDSVPEDAASLMLISPKQPLSQKERASLSNYLTGGGSIVMFHDPGGAEDIPALAGALGLRVGQDVVLDQTDRLAGSSEIGWQITATNYGEHQITQALPPGAPGRTIFLVAGSVSVDSTIKDGATRVELVKTASSAWGETDLKLLFGEPPSASKDPDSDLSGPISLAAAYEGAIGTSAKAPARVVVIGDSEWVRNVNFQVYSNRELALGALNWAARSDELISVRPGVMRGSRMPITSAQLKLILAVSFLLPELMLLLGLAVWWRRRFVVALP